MTPQLPSALRASPANASALLTLEQFCTYDDGTDTHYELENGILVTMPPESPENDDIARGLLFTLANYVPLALLSTKTEVEVTGRRASCRLPDLLVHTEDSKAALKGSVRATLTREMPPPALVVEIVSPGAANRKRDYRYKRTEYAAREILEYWIIDPEEQRITVCRWLDGQYEDTCLQGSDRLVSDVIPEFSLTVAEIFALGKP
jgi:Uma2 family endonuclease